MKKFWIWFSVVVLTAVIGLTIFFTCTVPGKTIVNNWMYGLEKVDEGTYENQKKVEDTCRAMIASYNQDKLVYGHYKDSSNSEERSWANNAKIRANNTAANYNNYILKNNYVWKNNIPSDISTTLEYIK